MVKHPKFTISNSKQLNKINLGILDYIYYYTGVFGFQRQREKKAIIEMGTKIVKACLDMKFMIKKFYELEKIKQLLLKPEDYDAFEKMEKPVLKVEFNKNFKKNERNFVQSFLGNEKQAIKP